MKPESEELLSLLADGEQVDPDALAAALAEPDAAERLVQYARTHRAVLGSDLRPSDQFYDKMRRQLKPPSRRTIAWRAPLAAAAAVMLSLLGGMWIGWSALPPRAVPVRVVMQAPGPTPIRDEGVRKSPGASPTTSRSAAAGPPPECPASGPPKPDRVVEFVPGGENTRPGVAAGGNRP